MMDGTTSNERTVYNASASAVGAGYFPVWRDKLGTWWATASGSTASMNRFRFSARNQNADDVTTIDSSDGVDGSLTYALWPTENSGTAEWKQSSPVDLLTPSAWNDPTLQFNVSGKFYYYFQIAMAWHSWNSGAPADNYVFRLEVTIGTRSGGSGAYGSLESSSLYDIATYPDSGTAGGTATGWRIDHSAGEYFDSGDQLRFTFKFTPPTPTLRFNATFTSSRFGLFKVG